MFGELVENNDKRFQGFDSVRNPPIALTTYLRTAVAALLAVAAVFVVSRRLAGALETPLRPFQLLAAGVLLAGLAWVAHLPSPKHRLRTASPLISLATLAIAAALSLSGSHGLALFGFWAVIVGEELWAWRSTFLARTSNSPRPGRLVSTVAGEGQGLRAEAPLRPPQAPALADNGSIEEGEPAEPAVDVLQQLTLRGTATGGQELSGWLRMPLAAGQRTGSLHVVFCPSFPQTPQVQAEPVSGPGCRVKVAQVLTYGARLDVRLDALAGEEESVLVWFFAATKAQ